VRNGGNPVTNEDLGRDAHWFDGDGMLSGIAFRRQGGHIQPEFVNQYILTDAYISTATTPSLRLPILPSIATLVNPASTLLTIILRIFRSIFLVAVPGIKSAKMMHDFGVSFTHTVIMNLPLSLDPRNLARNRPAVEYDPSGRSRFGVFPRWNPEAIRWFETNPCCIFHTANTWDEEEFNPYTSNMETTAVNMLACRLTSFSLVYSAGDIAAPIPKAVANPAYPPEEEQCRLYYYRFPLTDNTNSITHQFALTAIPFEFPSLRNDASMSSARYIYGCSVSDSSFGAALGRAVKIDSLVKVDATTLVSRAKNNRPTPITGCVDTRTVPEILASQDPNDPIKIFKLPPGFYAQESRFVPRKDGKSEDDGWILSYVFDESQLDVDGNAGPGAKSELWVVDARDMREVVCRVQLPQRVPYGLHGNWFSEEDVLGQWGVESIRTLPSAKSKDLGEDSVWMDVWMGVRKWMLDVVG
jgi:carotenoid cleavage dioxygenase-like enzyme